MGRPTVLISAATGAVVAAALWWRTHPSACPYGQRFWVEAPHPFIARDRLRAALEPHAGQTVLEVGPGPGHYTLAVARRLLPEGVLHILDVQPEMLEHTMRRATQAGLTNIEPRRGDARALPYDDGAFHAAYLVAVLGEVPDQHAALGELRRILKPGGRLVVGELFGDPHMVGESTLRRRAAEIDLRFERRIGPRWGYFAVLRKAQGPD